MYRPLLQILFLALIAPGCRAGVDQSENPEWMDEISAAVGEAK